MIKSEINKEAYRLLQKNLTDRKLLKSLSISQKKMLQLIKDVNWTDKIDFIWRWKTLIDIHTTKDQNFIEYELLHVP